MFDLINQSFIFLLESIHNIIGDYGWAIILITVAFRLLLWPVSKSQMDSMAQMQALQPKMKAIQDRYKNDPQQLQQEMMKYRELVGKSQLEIQKKERDLTVPIVKKLREIIEDVAKKDGYTMILEKSEQSVLWAQKEADLTDRVVKEFEKKK